MMAGAAGAILCHEVTMSMKTKSQKVLTREGREAGPTVLLNDALPAPPTLDTHRRELTLGVHSAVLGGIYTYGLWLCAE